jgi:hypothetical protein
MVRMDSHQLELYSEYWTTLPGDGESRVSGWVIGFWVERGVPGRRKADFSTALRSGRNDDVWLLGCAPVEMTLFIFTAATGIWRRLPSGIAMDYSLL